MNMFGLKYLSVCELYALEEIHAFATVSVEKAQGIEVLLPMMSTGGLATKMSGSISA